MRKSLLGLLSAVALVAGAASANAQDTIKVGVILVLSGQFADAGAQMLNGIKTYMRACSSCPGRGTLQRRPGH